MANPRPIAAVGPASAAGAASRAGAAQQPPRRDPNAQWQVPPAAASGDDQLLGCLKILARLLAKDVSVDTLTAGLPLVEGRLTPDLFDRAAERALLTSKIVRRPLKDIPNLVLPAVLMLTERKACVLVNIGNGRATIVMPDSGAGERQVSMDTLESLYSGYAIFVQAKFRFEERTADSVIARPRHWFWGVVAQSWSIYAEVIVASFLLGLFALALPMFTMAVYDRVVPNRTLDTLWVLAIGVAVVLVFDFVMRTLRGYFIDTAGKKVDVMLSANIHERILGMQMAARPPSVGSFASSLQEFEAFREFITSATITTLIDLPFAILFIVAIGWIAPELAMVCVVAMTVILIASFIIQGPLSRSVQASMRLGSQRQAMLIENLIGLETLKIVRGEGAAQRKWEQVIGQMANNSQRTRLLSAIAVNFSMYSQQVASLAMIVAGVYLIADDRLTMGGLIACSLLTGRAIAPMSQIAGLMTRFHQSKTAITSMDKLMQLPVERPAGKDFVHRPRLRGAIEFRNVKFAYPNRENDALVDVSFTIQPGERVALIGRIGSGKSTIEKLVLGLYGPKEGTVLIDGADIRQLDPAALRRDVGYVPQDVNLFYGSVRDNILMGAPFADDSAMLRAAEVAGVVDFINTAPNGFDLQVGERGEHLSGGQRQSIGIARAEVLAPPVLLLDEPTSGMDARSEEQFKARLGLQLAGRTLIVVTHRPSLLGLVNRIIVMDQGRVVADGPKAEILAALNAGKIQVSKN